MTVVHACVLSGLSECCVEWVYAFLFPFLFMKSMRICYVPIYYLTLHACYMYTYYISVLIFNLPRQELEKEKAIYSTHYKYITIKKTR